MSPAVIFAISPEGWPIQVDGDIGVKREYGKEVNKIHLCVKDQGAVEQLRDFAGEEVLAIVPDKSGIVKERSTGLIFDANAMYTAPEGQSFEMGTVEIDDGVET